MANRNSDNEVLESGVVHFRAGEDLGLRLMEIAMEHLTERNDPIKAIKTITDSLQGCPTDIAIKILKGDMVLPVDVESQEVICQTRIEGLHDIFPKIDPCYWIERRKDDIENHGNSLIAGFKELQKQIRINKKYVTVNLSYEEIFKFVSGKDENMLDYLRDNYYEVDAIANLIETTRKYIEFSMSIIKTMDWMIQTFDEFKDNNLFTKYNCEIKGGASQMLTDVMFVLKETLNFEFNMDDIESDSLKKFIDASQEIDAVIEKGIEPVNIIDKYDAGWLSPNGEFYGLNGEFANMLHQQIADALQAKGIVPEVGVEDGNTDGWLSNHGWVKIHHEHINYDGYTRYKLSKPNIPMTQAQIDKIYLYIGVCYLGKMKVGLGREFISATRFRDFFESGSEKFDKLFDW
ncbi:MAG TPA: hypothetical protein VK172_10295 [Lentimicrobium sp.]|nr:hypothetical protein [Lentimicrobium sp.]